MRSSTLSAAVGMLMSGSMSYVAGPDIYLRKTVGPGKRSNAKHAKRKTASYVFEHEGIDLRPLAEAKRERKRAKRLAIQPKGE